MEDVKGLFVFARWMFRRFKKLKEWTLRVERERLTGLLPDGREWNECGMCANDAMRRGIESGKGVFYLWKRKQGREICMVVENWLVWGGGKVKT